MASNQRNERKKERVLPLWKPPGPTPLQAVEQLRRLKPHLADEVLGYAGRLDPLAEGVMLVLVGEENKRREKYLALDKEYEFEVLFGFQTESHDVMSRPEATPWEFKKVSPRELVGRKLQPYPKHSSKRIAKNYAEVPPKEVEIYSLDSIKEYTQTSRVTLEKIEERLAAVTADFGQGEFLKEWEKVLVSLGDRPLQFAAFRTRVSSGTYVRLLAHQMGGLAWRITRTRVGPYTPKGAILIEIN